MCEFEKWLRQECFQKPTPEAYGLAKGAWKKALTIGEARGRVLGMGDGDINRAVEMLRIAAEFIREHAPEDVMHYDEADCDGYCVADDCENVADAIRQATQGGLNADQTKTPM